MNIPKFDPEKLFFVADSHFCHEAIIKYCERPFKSVGAMNEAIIENWNSVIGPKDTVFHLGDFELGSSEKLKNIINQLHGEIHLIKGNHDFRQSKGVLSLFKEVTLEKLIEVDGYKILMNHYPLLCYSGSHRSDAFQLFGHVHTRTNTRGTDAGRLQYLYPNQLDVGVDGHNFTPWSFAQVKERIQEQIVQARNKSR